MYVGETVYESENFWIKIDSVHDGRCPQGVMCVWEGEAKVWLSVSFQDSVETISIFHLF